MGLINLKRKFDIYRTTKRILKDYRVVETEQNKYCIEILSRGTWQRIPLNGIYEHTNRKDAETILKKHAKAIASYAD